MKQKIQDRFYKMFTYNTANKMAVATSMGLFFGIFPIGFVKIIITLLLSFVFDLNIIAILIGFSMTVIFSAIRVIHFNFPIETAFGQQNFVISTFLAIVLAFAFFPILRWFYKSSNEKREKVEKEFVFYNKTGYRWFVVKRFLYVNIFVSIVTIGLFVLSLNIDPTIPSFGLNVVSKFTKFLPINKNIDEHLLINQLKLEEKNNPTHQFDYEKKHLIMSKVSEKRENDKKLLYAFYVNWDENSKQSLIKNLKNIDVLVPEWFFIDDKLKLKSDMQSDIIQIANKSGIKIMPLVNNFWNNNWNKNTISNLISSDSTRANLINELLNVFLQNGFYGINLDFESIDIKDQDKLTKIITEISDKFHKNGLKVTIDVPANNPAFDYGAIAKVVDNEIIMLYDEHDSTSTAGPIASFNWYKKNIEETNIPSEKIIAGVGCYGYDWNLNSKDGANPMTFGDIAEIINQTKIKVMWNKYTKNPYLQYIDSGEKHIVWFLDAITFYNQMKVAQDNDIDSIAIWRLGAEDPTIWTAIENRTNLENNINKLKKLVSPDAAHYTGDGEILKILYSPQEGKRDFILNKDGILENETYVNFPKPFEIQRFGKPAGKKVVLTFDDGPNEEYTPKILNILKKNNVKATFFVVGENVEKYPYILKRIFNEGHEIGSHTFTHPNVAEISDTRTKLELNATQRLIQELIGHSVTMFRPPYVADAEPSTPQELLPILRAQNMGYLMIGELIDPSDWEKPESSEIVKRIENELPRGNIILLHDAGGDRTNTVKALPQIIKALKDKGYEFVTISSLLGKNREALMPTINDTKDPFMEFDKIVFNIGTFLGKVISEIFYTAIIIGIFRFIFLIYFALKQKRKYNKTIVNKEYNHLVSVVIAAYNEENVICKTINSILQSTYEKLEVIIVNDGSKDATAKAVQDEFGNNPKVKIINKENGGKASAINMGYQNAKGEIIASFDADTLIDKNAIELMVRHFEDKNIGAVSGNVKVGNRSSLLTIWQSIEYITGFNLERRAFAELNCITVVPGAISAWRKDAVAVAGYFKEDTLAEDTDATLTLLRQGFKIVYEEKALAFTEAPEDLKSLLIQRFRWSFGTLQCLWKHKGALFNRNQKTLGFIALPNMWIFQYLFQSISPIADLMLIVGIFGSNPLKIILFYFAFFIMDLITSVFAFELEKEDKKPLLWLFLQRILYRQLMTFVILKSIIYVFKGELVGWNKLKRTGNARNQSY